MKLLASVCVTLLLSACGPNPSSTSGAPAAAGATGKSAAADRYDITKMDLKPVPAKLSNERHTGPFALGNSLNGIRLEFPTRRALSDGVA